MIDDQAVIKVEAYFKRAETLTRDRVAQSILAATMAMVEQNNNSKGKNNE